MVDFQEVIDDSLDEIIQLIKSKINSQEMDSTILKELKKYFN